MYDLEKTYNFTEILEKTKSLTKNDLMKVKFIFSMKRSCTDAEIERELLKFNSAKSEFVAIDLVGYEDNGRPLKDFQWLKTIKTPLVLHCGETLGFGTPADDNLVNFKFA